MKVASNIPTFSYYLPEQPPTKWQDLEITWLAIKLQHKGDFIKCIYIKMLLALFMIK